MLDPFFLEGHQGRLFCSVHRPRRDDFPSRAVLCVPPFAEEMNKSRRMLSLLGQGLAAQGVACLLPDVYGTGDSEGDFADASWDLWLDDLQRCVQWLTQQGVTDLTVLGLRSGALLAMQLQLDCVLKPKRIVLWQPVAKGKLLLTQFLRIRLASGLTATAKDSSNKETTGTLRERFAQGMSVEVAGYEISAPLAVAMDGIALSDFMPLDEVAVHWLEVVAEGGDIAPVGKKIIESWQQQGAEVLTQSVGGESFWMTQEIAEAPELITETVSLVLEGALSHE